MTTFRGVPLDGQGNLFIGTFEPDKPKSFDHKAAHDATMAEKAKAEAMQRVEAHADITWKQAAYQAVIVCADSLDEFTSDDVMDYISSNYWTHEPRALGPVMLKAARDGLIVKTGTVRNSTRRSLHASPRQVWRRAG